MKVIITLAKIFNVPDPKAGKRTGFAEMVKAGKKIHTCRENYPYWKGKIDTLKENGGQLCVREWTGRPYRSTQVDVVELDSSLVEVERLDIRRKERPRKKESIYIPEVHLEDFEFSIGGKPVGADVMQRVAENDGFTRLEDFLIYFDLTFRHTPPDEEGGDTKTLTLAIIHFRPFRYMGES